MLKITKKLIKERNNLQNYVIELTSKNKILLTKSKNFLNVLSDYQITDNISNALTTNTLNNNENYDKLFNDEDNVIHNVIDFVSEKNSNNKLLELKNNSCKELIFLVYST